MKESQLFFDSLILCLYHSTQAILKVEKKWVSWQTVISTQHSLSTCLTRSFILRVVMRWNIWIHILSTVYRLSGAEKLLKSKLHQRQKLSIRCPIIHIEDVLTLEYNKGRKIIVMISLFISVADKFTESYVRPDLNCLKNAENVRSNIY